MGYTREETAAIEARYASRRVRACHRLAAEAKKRANARRAGEAGFWALYLGTGTVDDLRAFRGVLPRPLNLLLPDMCWGAEHSQMGDTVAQLARAMVKGTLRPERINGGRCAADAVEDARALLARVVERIGELAIIQAKGPASARRRQAARA